MPILNVVLPAIIFLAVTGGVMVILLKLVPTGTQRRLDSITDASGYAPERGYAGWNETMVKLAQPFATLSLPSQGWEQSPLRLRFIHAGYRGNAPVALYFGAKTLLALVLPALTYLYMIVASVNWGTSGLASVLLLTAAIGYYIPNAVLSRLVFLRQREVFETFPDAADLMLVCVESGLGLDAALLRVADEIRIKSRVLAEELHLLNLEIRAGAGREKALRNLALRTGVEEIGTFVTMLIQTDRFGTSIGEALRVFSDELRTKRKLRAEELAAKIPLKLLFPLIFFIFPSLLLVLLGPAFIQVYRILLPAMAGQ
jgi:tight adherence protein C